MARIPLPASRVRARRRKRITRAIIAWCILLSVIWIVVVGISWIPQLRIQSVDVAGAQTIASTTIAATVDQELSGTYGYMFPRNNVLLYPKQEIASTLTSEFSPVKKVTVSKDSFRAIRVDIVERAPVALWCGEDPTAPTDCTYLDQTGIAYTQSPDFSDGVYVRYFGQISISTPPHFLPSGEFQSLVALIDVIGEKIGNDKVVSVAIDENRDVHVSLLSGCQILFFMDEDGATIVSDLVLALHSDAFVGRSLADFEYLDLRFGDKLYYKMKTQQQIQATASSTLDASTTSR